MLTQVVYQNYPRCSRLGELVCTTAATSAGGFLEFAQFAAHQSHTEGYLAVPYARASRAQLCRSGTVYADVASSRL